MIALIIFLDLPLLILCGYFCAQGRYFQGACILGLMVFAAVVLHLPMETGNDLRRRKAEMRFERRAIPHKGDEL